MKKNLVFTAGPLVSNFLPKNHKQISWTINCPSHDAFFGFGEATVCDRQLKQWFAVPEKCKEIRITVSDKPLKNGYRCRFTRVSTYSTLGSNSIFDEHRRFWVNETLTSGCDRLLMRLFLKKITTLKFFYWVEVATLDGT